MSPRTHSSISYLILDITQGIYNDVQAWNEVMIYGKQILPSVHLSKRDIDSLAERSKALAQGASPQGRGFEPHSCHSL